MNKFKKLINAGLLETFKNEQDKEFAPKQHAHKASDITDLQTIKGDGGVGISDIQKITDNIGSGASNTIMVTLTDGTTKDFTVNNGAQGAAGTNGISVTKAHRPLHQAQTAAVMRHTRRLFPRRRMSLTWILSIGFPKWSSAYKKG